MHLQWCWPWDPLIHIDHFHNSDGNEVENEFLVVAVVRHPNTFSLAFHYSYRVPTFFIPSKFSWFFPDFSLIFLKRLFPGFFLSFHQDILAKKTYCILFKCQAFSDIRSTANIAISQQLPEICNSPYVKHFHFRFIGLESVWKWFEKKVHLIWQYFPLILADKPLSLRSLIFPDWIHNVFKNFPEFPDFPDRWEPCLNFAKKSVSSTTPNLVKKNVVERGTSDWTAETKVMGSINKVTATLCNKVF